MTHEKETTECPIWGTRATCRVDYIAEGFNVSSPRAGGEYFVDKMAAFIVSKLNDREKARLTTWLIEQRRLGIERPELPSRDEIESIVQRRDLTVHARADELLKYIQEKTSYIGQDYGFTASNPPMELLAYTECVEEDEFQYLLRYLFSQNWLELTAHETHTQNMNVIITVKGYGRLSELETVFVASSKAFVAMWFHDSVEDAWTQGIEPAIKNSGYDPVLIKNQEFIGKIDDQIIAEIRRSRFLVADFTQGDDGARGGVYYEAGFAHGLNIPVIFTARKDIVDRKLIHFDTRQFNHIDWESPEELRERLTQRISAEIGDGPLKN